ncbi:hypothetical protein [Solirubrobacter soli]|uniref:hypothetical protein n=1 Tax=Solirubrobacter soli TaxID=363832 RepID=UPI00048472A1|nr:hypothetical protein [Solirubrobacter soli]
MRTLLLSVALVGLFAAPASAELHVVDPVAGTERVVAAGEEELLGWSDDGAALWIRSGRRVLRVAVADGAASHVPGLDDAEAIGPGGRWATDGEVHEADGRVTARYDVSPLDAGEPPPVAWSRDGARVAVLSAEEPLAADSRLIVFDTATGAVLARRRGVEAISPQAFAPDGSALLVVTRKDVLRLAVPGAKLLERRRLTSFYGQVAVWSATGAVAIAQRGRIEVDGGPRIGVDNAEQIAWSGDGTFLAYRFSTPRTRCAYPQSGLDAVAPGETPRVVLAPGAGELRGFAWAPAGHALAVDVEPAPAPAPRGQRHSWPRRVAVHYGMPTRAGDRALRRLVLRAARSLRRDAARATVLARVQSDYEAIAGRYGEAADTAVLERLGHELDRWLHAAGWARLGSLREITC